jgi:hypothetical protein
MNKWDEENIPKIYFHTNPKCMYLQMEGVTITFGVNEKKLSGNIDSKDKTCCSLNHFMDYFFLRGEADRVYHFISMLIVKADFIRFKRANIVKLIEENPDKQSPEIIMDIFKETMKFDRSIFRMVIEYTVGIAKNDIEYDAAKTDSLRYSEVDIINALSTMIKIIYVLYAMLNTDTMAKYIQQIYFYLLNSIAFEYTEYLKERIEKLEEKPNRTEDEETELNVLGDEYGYIINNSINENIEDFLRNIFINTWESKHTPKHRERFHNIGQDDEMISDKSIILVIVSLYKFTPVLVSEDLIPKYTKDPTIKIFNIKYMRGLGTFNDFKFVHLNTTKFIRTAIEFILKNVSKTKMEEFTNTSVHNMDDETSFRSELYYSDKKTTMLPLKRPIILKLINLVTKDPEVIELANIFKDYKKHTLNEMLFRTFLKIIEGENIMIGSLFGQFKFFIIAAIYKFLRDKTPFTTVCEAMNSNTVDYKMYTEDDLKIKLAGSQKYLNYGDIYLSSLRDICTHYRSNNGKSISLYLDEALGLFNYLSNYNLIRKEFLIFYDGYTPLEYDNPESVMELLATKTHCPDEKIVGIFNRILDES